MERVLLNNLNIIIYINYLLVHMVRMSKSSNKSLPDYTRYSDNIRSKIIDKFN